VTIQGGAGIGGQITFGWNAGQLNIGAKVGAAIGFSVDVVIVNEECEEAGLSGEVEVGGEIGFISHVDARLSFSDAYGGEMGLGLSGGNLGAGAEYNVKSGFSDLKPSVSFGASGFMGAGVNFHF